MKQLLSAMGRLCIVLALTAPSICAQTGTGLLDGTVSDPSGAVVPGAKLTATNTATGVAFATESNAEGLYRFAVLPIGTYDLTVEKPGFATQTRKAVEVTVGAKVTLDWKVTVSSTQETVNVMGEAPLVETTRTAVSTSVDSMSVANLPVNGRNFIEFVLLTPGVTRDPRTGDISFGGQRGTLNSLTVDGADDNNTFFGQTSGRTGSGRAPYQFSQDAVEEFQVNSNGYSAEFGRAGGAVINVVTKSGSNVLHGTAFEFYRDRGLAANDPIVKLNHGLDPTNPLTKPAYHFHQFGGNVGGPILKNRAFFFFDYDGQRNTQLNPIVLSIPMIAAPTAFERQAITYLQARAGSWTRGLNQDTYLLKGDLNISGSHLLSMRWNRQNFTGLGFENGGPTNSSEHTGASIVNSDTVSASLTSTLSTTVVNVFRYNWQRDNEPGQANSILPEATVRQTQATLLLVGRNSFSPRFTNINRHQVADTVAVNRGRHGFKFGADFIHDGIANFFPGNFSGAYSFNCLENFGRSLAGAPLVVSPGQGCTAAAGNPAVPGDSFSQAFAGPGTSGPLTQPNIFEAAWFVQDDWRVRENLTLNLGLRWDLQDTAKPPVNNPVAAAAGIRTDQLNINVNNYGPRIGFAWTPKASGLFVVRGGYGIFYGRTPSIMIGTAHSNNGINVQTKTFAANIMPSYPNTICGTPVDSPNCAAPTAGVSPAPSIYVMQPNFRQPIIQQSNLNLEWQAAKDFSVTVGWQMVKGNHLQRTRDINLGTPTTAFVTFSDTGQTVGYLRYPSARPTSAFARISQFESSANSLYHGGFVQVRKRMSRNFQGMMSYTWSHVIDDTPDATAVVPFSSGDDSKMLADPQCARCDRASGLSDQRHRLVISGIWQLNYANNLSPVPKALLGGWEISTIFNAQSGQPFSGWLGVDLNNDSNRLTDRAPGQGRNIFTLPSTWSLDPRFTKKMALTERVNLQLFAEAFNIFNHFNPQAVKNTQYTFNSTTNTLTPLNTGINAFRLPTNPGPGCGCEYQYSSPSLNLNGARIFQLGAKITF